MKSKLIRVLIVLCFVGMATFGVVVFLGNHNTAQKTYEQIITIRDNAKFDNFFTKADGIKASFSGDQCKYVDYINDATKELNEAIDYYLFYYQNLNNVNKTQSDELLGIYQEYIEQINEAKRIYERYVSYVNKQSPNSNEQAQVGVQSAYFAKQYLTAYSKGYSFFIKLQDLVEEKFYNNNMFKSFRQISYEMGAVFVHQSINPLVAQLEKKIAMSSYITTPETVSNFAKNFIILNTSIESGTYINDTTEYRNQTYAKFISDYNKLKDAEQFLIDSTTYIASNPTDSVASAVRAFLVNTSYYGFNMGGAA